ncbi:hypothetical protein D3C76_1539810 [compost metagenome]
MCRENITLTVTLARLDLTLDLIDMLRQFVRPVLWLAFLRRADLDSGAKAFVLHASDKRTCLDPITDFERTLWLDLPDLRPLWPRLARTGGTDVHVHHFIESVNRVIDGPDAIDYVVTLPVRW